MQKSKNDLKKVSRQFKLWRSHRRNQRSAMPEDLWKAAACLCATHPIGRVRAELGIDYGKLKAKVAEFKKASGAPGFINVELPIQRSSDPVCEWVRPDGARLRARVAQGQLNQIVAEFFGGRR
jgi:hypothetical protein